MCLILTVVRPLGNGSTGAVTAVYTCNNCGASEHAHLSNRDDVKPHLTCHECGSSPDIQSCSDCRFYNVCNRQPIMIDGNMTCFRKGKASEAVELELVPIPKDTPEFTDQDIVDRREEASNPDFGAAAGDPWRFPL